MSIISVSQRRAAQTPAQWQSFTAIRYIEANVEKHANSECKYSWPNELSLDFDENLLKAGELSDTVLAEGKTKAIYKVRDIYRSHLTS